MGMNTAQRRKYHSVKSQISPLEPENEKYRFERAFSKDAGSLGAYGFYF